MSKIRVVQYEKLTVNPLKEMKEVIEFIDPQQKYVQWEQLENYVSRHTNCSQEYELKRHTTYR